MPIAQGKRLQILIILSAGIVSATVFFGVRKVYSPQLYFGIAAIHLALIFTSALLLGDWTARDGSDQRRLFATSGLLFVTPFALFSLLAGIGPPGGQTAEENHLRYLVLLINAIAVGGGFVLVREALKEAGERFYTTIGFAAILFATPLYIIWGSIMLEFSREARPAVSGDLQPWYVALADFSDILLYFGGVLTYLATAAFAAALVKTKLLKRGAGAAMIITSFAALLILGFRGLKFPDPNIVFDHWYTIPGFFVSVPAVPWMMPCVLGVILLWRAGDKDFWSGTRSEP